MSELTGTCSRCNTPVNTEFVMPGGLRRHETITSDLFVSDPCFVRDVIEFKDSGRLIFIAPKGRPTVEGEQPNFAVICRKLIVNGGNKPISVTPCNPGDPGTRYGSTNVITWDQRLHGAAAGAPPAPTPPQTADDVVGTAGAAGNTGDNGVNAPAKLSIFALEVEVLNGGHLVVDWGGQDGGDGGKGQNGGRGGKGSKGSGGSDESWPSSGCKTETGDGMVGATGGRGGDGGQGGRGGDAGFTAVISTPANIGSGGVFQSSSIIFVNDGGLGGHGGKGGNHGQGGPGGPPGKKSSECDAGNQGPDGSPGDDGTDITTPGASGASKGVHTEAAVSGTCADLVPLQLVFNPIGTPIKVCRCFSGSGDADISLTGQFLDQVASIATSLAGVTATRKASSTDTQLDLKIAMTGASATGVGNLIFTPLLGPAQTLNSAIEVGKTQITAIAPNTAARGGAVTVTITGQCFDVAAPVHDVTVSGLGADALNVAVVDDLTMTCQISITATAAVGARSVTVKAGSGLSPCQHTLVNGFTIT